MTQSQLIDEMEAALLKQDLPEFKVGDTISVHYRIIEGEKERIQIFTGTVIARKGNGISETVSIYRTAYGSAMERVLPIHSPKIAKIEVIKYGKVRRGKLYHLRGVFGKKAKIQERIVRQKKEKPEASVQAPAIEEGKVEAPAPAKAEVKAKEVTPKKEAKPKKAPAKKKTEKKAQEQPKDSTTEE